MKTFKGKHFLHIAGGTGVLTRFLQDRKALAVNLDYDKVLNSVAKIIGNRRVIRADATTTLPFANNSFECLITDHFVFAKYKLIDMSTEHEGSQALLKEAVRVLKKDGIFVVNAVDLNLPPREVIEICEKYFHKVEPFAYQAHDYREGAKYLIPMLILTSPRKEIL